MREETPCSRCGELHTQTLSFCWDCTATTWVLTKMSVMKTARKWVEEQFGEPWQEEIDE